MRVVYNGIDVDRFQQAISQRELIRSQLGFASDDFVIAQIGLMMPRKRPEFLLDAASAILKDVPHAQFLFIGDSSPGQENYLAALQDRAAQLGVINRVRFLPFQRNIAPYFGAIDLNMLVSSDEGFGRVIIEAGAAGVPDGGQ